MIRMVRLKKEMEIINDSSLNSGIWLFPKSDSLESFEAHITGPKSTPYEEGLFKLEILIPNNYPFNPPSIKFVTKVYHPNIDDSGRICLDLLKMPPKGSWKPLYTIQGLLIAIRMLLENPNTDDPLMVEIANEYKRDKVGFIEKAKAFTKTHACGE
ncbi:hypothetical protein ABEB36_007360 [Hypothenemus hampei]|uniref:UBC core domain-containing protein n=1 Tax=Hypothenemus hampei TaxID=57062 RepID=A0ABD1EU97_HYPHA